MNRPQVAYFLSGVLAHFLTGARSVGSVSNLAMRLLVMATGLLCLTWPLPAFACTCDIGPATTAHYRAWLKGFDGAVFRGTAIESTIEAGVGTKVTFKVERHWKGVTSPAVAIQLLPARDNCPVEFRRGGTYLVAARRLGRWFVYSVCLQVLTIQKPAALLEALGEGSPPPTQSPRLTR